MSCAEYEVKKKIMQLIFELLHSFSLQPQSEKTSMQVLVRNIWFSISEEVENTLLLQ